MTLHNEQDAIKQAKKHGYNEDNAPTNGEGVENWPELALQDPAFWQALGNARGWGKLHCVNCGEFAKPVRKKESDPEYWADCCGRKRRLEYGVSWKYHALRYFETLLTSPEKIKEYWENLP